MMGEFENVLKHLYKVIMKKYDLAMKNLNRVAMVKTKILKSGYL